uniref:Uncharacterized protein n=1 Tax=Sander lucioperca TaxID=283035 RepID=A0A8C9XG95_SANLU
MNKQPSKESLKGKVEEIFGQGHPQPPSKQSETRPSEFIITTDIIKEHNWTAGEGRGGSVFNCVVFNLSAWLVWNT